MSFLAVPQDDSLVSAPGDPVQAVQQVQVLVQDVHSQAVPLVVQVELQAELAPA